MFLPSHSLFCFVQCTHYATGQATHTVPSSLVTTYPVVPQTSLHSPHCAQSFLQPSFPTQIPPPLGCLVGSSQILEQPVQVARLQRPNPRASCLSHLPSHPHPVLLWPQLKSTNRLDQEATQTTSIGKESSKISQIFPDFSFRCPAPLVLYRAVSPSGQSDPRNAGRFQGSHRKLWYN